MRILIVGFGEVGRAHYEVLKDVHSVKAIDVNKSLIPIDASCAYLFTPDLILFAMRFSSSFVEDCKEYIRKYDTGQPLLINVLSTVPVGTTEMISANACHSTTRGLHPNLKSGLLAIPKHIGGKKSEDIAEVYRASGMQCVTHNTAKTTELAHILNNVAYGVNIALADEMEKLCRYYGVDYYEAIMRYTETNNEGYERLGLKSKRRMVLTPPNGGIGGHCVKMSAGLIPEQIQGPIISSLHRFGEVKNEMLRLRR
jgi:UDP-N-acetyl-D-mannosaminuronate dehydrogenase